MPELAGLGKSAWDDDYATKPGQGRRSCEPTRDQLLEFTPKTAGPGLC